MAESRQNAEWERASLVASLIFNANRGKSKPKKPNEFNPFAKKRKRRVRKQVATGATKQVSTKPEE